MNRARLYGPTHRALRRRWDAAVQSGAAICARCGLHISPGEPWDLDHHDTDKTAYLGPSHARCNRATEGRGHPDPPARSNGQW